MKKIDCAMDVESSILFLNGWGVGCCYMEADDGFWLGSRNVHSR
jgi:hypothetical protein